MTIRAWTTLTQPHHVLDPRRLLVTSTSNFGSPPARPEMPAGTILSIDPYGPDPIAVPAKATPKNYRFSLLSPES